MKNEVKKDSEKRKVTKRFAQTSQKKEKQTRFRKVMKML